MWYFTCWVLNIIIELLCVLAGRSAVDICGKKDLKF